MGDPGAITIVGGGLGAVRSAQSLRQAGFGGRLTICAKERHLPYDRPPLSKALLTGELDLAGVMLLERTALEELDVELVLGLAAVRLDRERKVIVCADGRDLDYDALIVATGASPRSTDWLSGPIPVRTLSTLDDCLALREDLAAGRRLVIVGAGFVGLEVASCAVKRGSPVTLVEREDEPLAAVLGTEIGARMRRWHENHGVEFRTGARVEGAARSGGIELAGGTVLAADVIVAAVGNEPNIGWLDGSGLEFDRGLVTDQDGRTDDPAIFAVGDVACVEAPDGSRDRAEHWTATTMRARQVSAAILGHDPPAPQPPYFWSDQFDTRLQFAGRLRPDAELRVEGDAIEETGLFAEWHVDDRLVAVCSIDDPQRFLKGRMALVRSKAAPTQIL